MPGKDLTELVEVPYSPNLTLFKSHKSFPRRKAQIDARRLSNPLRLGRNPTHADEETISKSSERIRSWIPEPSLIHTAHDHDMPLTPPIITMNHDDENWMDDLAVVGYIPSAIHISKDSEMITPIIQRSPPTPETTPPRSYSRIRALTPPLASRDPSADSFETAREKLSSDEDDFEVDSPSLHPSRQRWKRSLGNVKLRDIGLGLGLESEDEDPTPTETTPKILPRKHDFAVSNTLHGKSANGIDSFGRDDEKSPPGLDLRRKRFRTHPRVTTYPSTQLRLNANDVEPSLARSLSLRQRIQKSRHNPSPSMERFAEKIDWPLEEDFDIGDKSHEVENRRVSQISATSTIVEAMVIDTTPQRRRTLRHTNKTSDLKSDSPQANQSNRSSMISNNPSRRRLFRNSKSPDRGQRKSVATDDSESTSASLVKVQQDVLSQPLRPTTAPKEESGYFDLPHRERRAVSAVLPLSSFPKPENKFVKDMSPAAITQSSTSAGLVEQEFSGTSTRSAYIDVISTPGQPQAIVHLSDPSEVQGMSLDRSRSGEWSALRPRSALVTPFSLRSAHSSTPGILEVNEATAISIYPHTNQSILVIQQLAGGDSNDQLAHSAIIAGNANIALPLQAALPVISHSRRPLNSPLKNPREPPQPPAFKLIPPTPANVPPTTEMDDQQPSSARNRLSGSFGMVKRALSVRRYSDTFVSPLTRSLPRRHTVSSRRPGVGDDPDNKLHPFWRPRGFWDDLSDSDSDSEFGNTGFLAGSPPPAESYVRRNSHTTQTSAQGLSRSTSLTRRFTNSLGFNQHRKHVRSQSEDFHHISKENGYRSSNRNYEFIQPERRRQGIMPKMGYRLQFVGFKNLAAKIDNAKIRREEGKRERNREKLRGSIEVVKISDAPLMSGGIHDTRHQSIT